MDWNVMVQYLPQYEKAAWLTLRLGVAGIFWAILVGLVCAVLQYEKVPVLRRIVGAYVQLSRNTPLLVQLFFLYYGLPKIGIKTNAELCGIAGLAFLGGSYMAEAFRSGLEAIEPIQTESALSLGMSRLQTMHYVVLPQAVSISMPAFMANIIFLLKETSVFSAISLMELMTFKNPILKAILRVYLEFIRIMPQMVLLFLVYFGTTRAFGWDLSGETAAVIVFVLWGTAEMSDLVRGALTAIPKHQYESSEALGMSRAQTYWYIIIPQTVRRLIPLSINLITRMIKTTSLVLMIGVVEVLKVAQQIIEANRTASPNAAFGIYLTVFVLYFLACWPISLLAGTLEKKWK